MSKLENFDIRSFTLCRYFLEVVIYSDSHLPRRPTLSYQRLQLEQPYSDAELYDKIRRTVTNKQDLPARVVEVLGSLCIILRNGHVLITKVLVFVGLDTSLTESGDWSTEDSVVVLGEHDHHATLDQDPSVVVLGPVPTRVKSETPRSRCLGDFFDLAILDFGDCA